MVNEAGVLSRTLAQEHEAAVFELYQMGLGSNEDLVRPDAAMEPFETWSRIDRYHRMRAFRHSKNQQTLAGCKKGLLLPTWAPRQRSRYDSHDGPNRYHVPSQYETNQWRAMVLLAPDQRKQPRPRVGSCTPIFRAPSLPTLPLPTSDILSSAVPDVFVCVTSRG